MRARLLLALAILAQNTYAQITEVESSLLRMKRHFGGGASCLSFSNVDEFINMNGTATGTAVTTSNLATGSEGTSTTWNSASAHQTFGVSQVAMPAAITVNGSNHTCGFATQSLAMDDGTALATSAKTVGGSHAAVTVSGWIINTPATGAGSVHLWDLVAGTTQTHGFEAILQLNNSTDQSCGQYAFVIEASAGSTTHSSCIAASPASTYYYSFKIDFSANLLASLRIYTTSGTTFTQVGSEVTRTLGSTTDTVQLISYGNGESGTDAGVTTSFQNMMIDFSNNNYPNLPH